MTLHSNKFTVSELLRVNSTAENPVSWESKSKWAFLIHSSVLPIFRKFIKRYGVCYLWDTLPYKLQIDETFHDMRIVFITRKPDKVANIMTDLVRRSQYTFFWENRINLFRDEDNFHELEEFIHINRLKKFIVSVEVEKGINSHNKPIKVVTFSRQLKYLDTDLYTLFENFLNGKSPGSDHKIYHFYLTYAFSWLQPARLNYFDEPFKNKRIFSSLQMYLTCLRETSYKTEPHLDMIGLCSLKLAFCDFRNVTAASAELGYEIDQLIIRSLKRMTKNGSFIRDGQLSLDQYAFERNFNLNLTQYYMAREYFTYTFQDYFKYIKTQSQYFGYFAQFNIPNPLDYLCIMPPTAIHVSINLAEEHDAMQKIRKTTNLNFEVIGKKFAGMNYELFTALLSCKNVSSIILDTNYEWQKSNKPKFISDASNSKALIELIGGNEFHFIENCIESLEQISNIQNLKILTNASLITYDIFNSLKIAVIGFADITLTSVMLQNLLDYRFADQITILNCKIENEVRAWDLLLKFDGLTGSIIEDEKTWQYIYDFAAIMIRTSHANQFNFKRGIQIVTENKRNFELSLITFAISECGTRLELKSFFGSPTDMYYQKNSTNSLLEADDDISCYEFYQ